MKRQGWVTSSHRRVERALARAMRAPDPARALRAAAAEIGRAHV